MNWTGQWCSVWYQFGRRMILVLFVRDTRSGSVTLLLARQLQVRDKCCVLCAVAVGTNKPKMLFVLKICYLIQNMWWWGAGEATEI